MKALGDNNEWRTLEMRDAYYCPSAPYNLFPTSYIAKRGGVMAIMKNNQLVITNIEGETIVRGRMENGLGVLSIKPIDKTKKLFLIEKVSLEKMHQRLAHTAKDNIRQMLRTQDVKGLEVKDANSEFTCNECTEARMTKPHVEYYGSRPQYAPGESFSADVCGPIGVPSLQKNEYFIICKDENTCYRDIYFTKDRSMKNVVPLIMDYIEKMETQNNIKIKRFRSDNGYEFCNNQLGTYLSEKGIIHKPTVVESPH